MSDRKRFSLIMPLPYTTAVTNYGDRWLLVLPEPHSRINQLNSEITDQMIMHNLTVTTDIRRKTIQLEQINQKITDKQIISLSEIYFSYVEELYDDSVIDFARAIIQQTLKSISEK